MLNNQSGMTLKELVAVIVIITLLVLGSIPLFYQLREKAQERESSQPATVVAPTDSYLVQ